MMYRRSVIRLGLGFGAATLLPALSPALAQETEGGETAPAETAVEAAPTDYVLGSADAPVTMIEFASFTCPHCAAFHRDVLPELKARYIDTGKVRLVFREFPLDGLALRAGLMARCAPQAQYFNIVSALFDTQQTWARAADPLASLKQLGAMAGVSATAFDACMADEAATDAIIQERLAAQETYDIRSTPTFIIGGERIEGTRSVDTYVEVIERQLAAAS